MHRQLFAAFGAISLQLAAGCAGSDSGGSGPTLTITSIGWAEESIDLSYWTSPPPQGQTAFFDFFIHYDGDIAFGDIEYARVSVPSGNYWNVARTADFLDTTNKVIGGWHRMYASTTPNVLPIGTLRAEVKLTNGVIASHDLFVPAPASTSAGAYSTMYSQDAIAPPPASAPMVLRATLGGPNTFTQATQTITLTFSVTDAKVHDGWVWFYDASGAYVGVSRLFVDPATGATSGLFGGSTFHTDGTANTLTISWSDVALASGKGFGQISQFRVLLTDGAQYPPSASVRYDCRSISAAGTLTLQ